MMPPQVGDEDNQPASQGQLASKPWDLLLPLELLATIAMALPQLKALTLRACKSVGLPLEGWHFMFFGALTSLHPDSHDGLSEDQCMFASFPKGLRELRVSSSFPRRHPAHQLLERQFTRCQIPDCQLWPRKSLATPNES